MNTLSEAVSQLERLQIQLLRLLEEENDKTTFDQLRISQFNDNLQEIREQIADLTRKVERWLFKQNIDRRVTDRRVVDRRAS